jgi:hypothetical protein
MESPIYAETLDTDGWDDIVEAASTHPHGQLRIQPMDPHADHTAPLLELATRGPAATASAPTSEAATVTSTRSTPSPPSGTCSASGPHLTSGP